MRDIFVINYKVEIYYIVPFDKKDIAKSEKMLWNPKKKCWYKRCYYYDIDNIDDINLNHNFEIKEIIGDIPDEHIEYIVKEHENLRNSYLLEKKKNDERYEIMDLEAEFEYLSGQISKDGYERYLSNAW
jgi:hypothetical protein